MDVFTDDDELLLQEKLKEIIHELDNFTDIADASSVRENEDIYKVEITSLMEGLKKELVRVPKNKVKQLSAIEYELKKQLTKDKHLNIAILTKLLKDELNGK